MASGVGHVVTVRQVWPAGRWVVRCTGCRWWCVKSTYSAAVLARLGHERQGLLSLGL